MDKPVKRGRGRPPGAKNIKTLVKEEAKRDDKAELIKWSLRPLTDNLKPPVNDTDFITKAIQYFATCIEMETTPTKSGFALQMGWASKESMANSCLLPQSALHATYKRALEIIERTYMELAVQKNSVGSIFLLKSVFGHSDRVDITSQGNSMAPVNLTFMPPSLAPLNTQAAIIDNETRTLTLPPVDATVITEDTDDTGDEPPS